MRKPLLEFNGCGIYCATGDFYIDPWKPVKYAIITHAHSDHARRGHENYLAHYLSLEVLKYRLGDINIQTIAYNESTIINGVKVSFHPAGHIIGSAQIRVEYKGEVWVTSGDYKLEDDGLSTPFEPVKCHSFISECTFGMPVYKWKAQKGIFEDIKCWWEQNISEGRSTVLAGYSLGKAQRIMYNTEASLGPIYTHGAIENINEALRRNSVALPATVRITMDTNKNKIRKGIIICPPSAIETPWIRKFQPFSLGYCSGWMTLRGVKRRTSADRGFIISDHADWDGLVSAITATGCESVYLTHGYTASFARYLSDIGFDAHEAKTLYGGDEKTDEPDESPAELVNEDSEVITNKAYEILSNSKESYSNTTRLIPDPSASLGMTKEDEGKLL